MTDYGYSRISAYDRLQSGLSIQAQRERLLQIGISESDIFVDGGRSGGVHDEELEYHFKDGRYFLISIDLGPRKEFRRLISLLKTGDIVHYVKHDRLSRHNAFSDFFHLYCERMGVKLNCLDESNETIIRQMMGVLAQNELAKTMSRNASIQKSVFERGGWPYRPPMGYLKNSKVRDGEKRGQPRYPDQPEGCLLIDPETAPIVKALFDRMASGDPVDVASERVGIGKAMAYIVIRNRAYLGETHFSDDDWRPSPLIPRLVSDDVWKRANANIKGRSYRAGERKADYEPKVAS